MSWLIDNAGAIYVLLGIIAAGFVVAWRFNQRVKFLGYAAGVLVLLGLFWLLTRFVTTDAKQIETNVQAMATAVKDGNVDELFKHISKDFAYYEMSRKDLYEKACAAIKLHKVTDIEIRQFEAAEVSRTNKTAKARFRVTAWAAGFDRPFPFVTEATFILEENQWKMKSMEFFDPVRTNEKMRLPGI